MYKSFDEICMSPYNISYTREPFTNHLRGEDNEFVVSGLDIGTLDLSTGDIFISIINYLEDAGSLMQYDKDIRLMINSKYQSLRETINNVKYNAVSQTRLISDLESKRLVQTTQEIELLEFRLRFIKFILSFIRELPINVMVAIKRNVDTDMCYGGPISTKDMRGYFDTGADTKNVQLVLGYSGDNEKECYFDKANDIFVYDYNEFMYSDNLLSRCQNCGKYFIPVSRKDEKYCYYLFDSKHTCKEVGYANKLSADVVMSSYRKAYKTQHAKMQRNIKNKPDYKEQHFDPWVANAKEKLSQTQEGNMSVEDFKRWLNVK